MSTCMSCGGPLEWSPNGQGHARCTRCAGLYSASGGSLTPVQLEAPGGGFNPELQALFEQQLGFSARQVPPQPPSYFGGGSTRGGGTQPAPSQMQRIMQLSILAFVLLLLGGIAAYVGWILWTTLPH